MAEKLIYRFDNNPADADQNPCRALYFNDATFQFKLYNIDTAPWTVISQTSPLLNTNFIGQQIYFVAKNGVDTNAGTSIVQPFLTFTAAIAAANAQTPSSTNRFTIVCLDAGVYTEDIATADYICVHAPSAKIAGHITIAGNSCLDIDEIEITTGVAISKTATNDSWVRVRNIVLTGSGLIGILNTSTTGTLFVYFGSIMVGASGFGIGNSTSDAGHIDINGESIILNGNNAIGIASLGATSDLHAKVGHINEGAAGYTGTIGIKVYSGEIDADINHIAADTAISVLAGYSNSFVNHIASTTKYEILGSTGIINLFVCRVEGAQGTITAGATLRVSEPLDISP